MITRNQLSPAERHEWDTIFDSACFDSSGKPLPTASAAENLATEIDTAISMDKKWARFLSDDARLQGFQKMVKPWQNQNHLHTTVTGEQKVIKRSNIARVAKRDAEQGPAFIAAKLWEDATADDLLNIARAAESRIKSESITRRDALRCVNLIVESEVSTLGEAIALAGYSDLDEFLASEAAA